MYQGFSVYTPRQNRRKSLCGKGLRLVYWQMPYHIGAQQISCHSLEKKNILFGIEIYLEKSKDFACNCRYLLYNGSIREKKKEEKEKKMETIKITKNTSAVVNNGKVIYLIQNGIKTQDPLKVRYFQRMI
jgi:hypothetical protein